MDHRISDIHSAEHYTWGGVCDGWRLLADPMLSVMQVIAGHRGDRSNV